MSRRQMTATSVGVVLLLSCALANYSQQQMTVNEIVEKNIQAVGGMDKISKMKNFSFHDNGMAYYLSSESQMKMTSGKDPVITEVILVDQTSAKRNCFNKLSDFEPFLEQTFQIQAKLYSGLFTLENFKNDLRFQGNRKFGPKEYHLLSMQSKDLEIEFYVDTEDFLLKRIVFRGHNPDFGKYEINHDIGPYREVEGLKIPSSWFASQVGTRGTTHQVTDVKWNLELEKDFFTNSEVNVGKTDFSEGVLKGNIVDFEVARGNRLMISTNWTDDCIKRAGFESEDKLILLLGKMQLEVEFYTSQPPRSAYGESSILMLPSRGDENFVIYFLTTAYQDLIEKLEPLMSIQLKKKE